MDNSKQTYLQSLWQWGEDTKNVISESRVAEEIKKQWVSELRRWQDDVEKYLSIEESITENKLLMLKNEGERLVQSMKNYFQPGLQESVSYGQHKLPPLPYRYDALEPYISEKIMRLHHDKHHQSYVDGLNKAEKELYKAKQNQDEKLIKHWLREQAYNGSGHNLHTIFWFNMTPDSSRKPSGEIARRINEDFGSWKTFKELFSNAAASVEGVGWTILGWNPRSGRLVVQTFEKHQLYQYADIIPLLVLDVWEHAYYLQYETDRKAYINNWWNIVNWQDVNNRYAEAKKVVWPLY